MVFCVSYDLKNPNRNYQGLYEGIKSLGLWWHQTGSVWIVATEKSSVAIRDYLKQYLDNGDLLFVVAVKKNWAAIGFSRKEYDWIKGLPAHYWE